MKHLQDTLGLVALLLIASGVAVAQGSNPGVASSRDRETDQPIRNKAARTPLAFALGQPFTRRR